jgi:CheY-like chemotaxis protein
VLVVADTGQGMDPEVKERIFEPFFSTKGPSRGTGLGLATVYAIVKRHGGRIEVTSELNRGTVCSVYWPRASLETTSTAGSKGLARATGGRGGDTVLIAEDEELVRNVLVRMFERAGYRVLAAKNGREAVTLLEQHREDVRLAVLDVVMPELSGPEAYTRLVALRPDLPALFISGYADDTRAATRIPPGVKLLEKPVSADVLLGAVDALLAERLDALKPEG